MNGARAASLAVLGGSLIVATWTDERLLRQWRPGTTVLAGDFHVHGYPIDGTLPRWELQREAARRGLDVIAITNHNQTLAGSVASTIQGADVIVLVGQEITTPRFHMIAAGITRGVDWTWTADRAIEEIHRQGGVAIAAHPIADSWQPGTDAALPRLDGTEAAHPLIESIPAGASELAAFRTRVRAVNPDVAAIGSSDFHFFSDLGRCRTYLVVEERSQRGVLDAIRAGRTVAADPSGRLIGDPSVIEIVRSHLEVAPSPPRSRLRFAAAAVVLIALAALVVLK